MKSLRQLTQEIFKPDGILAAHLDSYESRPGQLEMALAVADILDGGKLVVEAETGIGKTLAYLIPAILSRQKTIISTNTLNLQEQILKSEIPFIRNHIDPEPSVLAVKGRQNYLCLYRWQQFAAHPQFEIFAPDDTKSKIESWLASTATGDRAELDWLEDNSPLWREISAAPSQCLGSKCPQEKICFITELRKKAAGSRVLIINHHLFFSDLALRRSGYGEVLPRYESVIFDEAHNLENVATDYFGFSISHFQLTDLAREIKLAVTKLPDAEQKKINAAAESLKSGADHFAALFPVQQGRYPMQEFIENCQNWENEVQALAIRLSGLESLLSSPLLELETLESHAARCRELHDRLLAAAGLHEVSQEQTYVRWYERREKTVILTVSPIDIAQELKSVLYPKIRSVIFTSGTLTVDSDFSFFCSRLGLDRDTVTVSFKSPFDYAGRTLLYVPAHSNDDPFPPPDQENFLPRITQAILQLLLASRGRGLVLFTSLKNMHKTYPVLAENLPYPIFIQGRAPRHKLLELFTDQTNSILLAVASFWEGINVPGESLSCVIIDKLPFEVPNDPVIMARINRILEDGGNPFMDFQLPRAVLALRQGIGRLMRTSADKGVLAILDVRLFTKSYGKIFLKSLPASPLTRDLADVVSYFSEHSEK